VVLSNKCMPNCTLLNEVYRSLCYSNVHSYFLSPSEGTIKFPKKKTNFLLGNCIRNCESLEISNTDGNIIQFVTITCDIKVKTLEFLGNFYLLVANPFFPSSLVWFLTPTHCRRKHILLHLITLNYAHTRARARAGGSTPPDEWSARSTDH